MLPYFVLQGNICALLATKDHVNVFLDDGAIVPDREGLIAGGGPDGRHLRGRDAQHDGVTDDVRADHRQQPRRRMAPAEATSLTASRHRSSTRQ